MTDNMDRPITTIAIDSKTLLYDIANYAYIESHKAELKAGDNITSHLISDVCADGNIDRIARVLQIAYDNTGLMLRPALSTTDTATAAVPAIPETYVYTVNRDLSKADCQRLQSLIHEYLTCAALHDWLNITLPEAAPAWAERRACAASALTQSRLCYRHQRRVMP